MEIHSKATPGDPSGDVAGPLPPAVHAGGEERAQVCSQGPAPPDPDPLRPLSSSAGTSAGRDGEEKEEEEEEGSCGGTASRSQNEVLIGGKDQGALGEVERAAAAAAGGRPRQRANGGAEGVGGERNARGGEPHVGNREHTSGVGAAVAQFSGMATTGKQGAGSLGVERKGAAVLQTAEAALERLYEVHDKFFSPDVAEKQVRMVGCYRCMCRLVSGCTPCCALAALRTLASLYCCSLWTQLQHLCVCVHGNLVALRIPRRGHSASDHMLMNAYLAQHLCLSSICHSMAESSVTSVCEYDLTKPGMHTGQTTVGLAYPAIHCPWCDETSALASWYHRGPSVA